MNPNPRIGVLLHWYDASMQLKTVMWRFRLRGLRWLQRNWPEERMRRELRGYDAATSKEWSRILKARNNR